MNTCHSEYKWQQLQVEAACNAFCTGVHNQPHWSSHIYSKMVVLAAWSGCNASHSQGLSGIRYQNAATKVCPVQIFHHQHSPTTTHCWSRCQRKGCSMLQLFQTHLSQASVFGIQSQLKGFCAHDDRSIPSTKANRKKCLGKRWREARHPVAQDLQYLIVHFLVFVCICILYVCGCVHMYLSVDLYIPLYTCFVARLLNSTLNRSVHHTVLCPTMPVLV